MFRLTSAPWLRNTTGVTALTSPPLFQEHGRGAEAGSTNPVILPFDPGLRGEAGEGFEVACAEALFGGEVQDAV